MNPKKNNPIYSVFLTIFLDMLGIGLIIPVLAPLILQNDQGLFAVGMSYTTKTILYGLLLGAFPLAQFISNPIIGSISDIYGRRKVLIYSLIATVAGYFILTIGIEVNSIFLIFLGRIIPGISSGNITIAYSAIADISEGKRKTKNFGLIGMAFGLGFIIGPFAGGVLSSPSYVSWFSNSTPFVVSALLAFVNLIIVLFNFPETLLVKRKKNISLMAGVHNINKAFTNPSLRNIFSIVFISTFGFAFFTQFFIVLLMGKFNYQQQDIGIFYGYLGIWIVISQGGLLRIVANYLKPEKILFYSMPLLFFALVLMLLPDKSIWLYFIFPLIAFGNSLTVSSLTAVVSNLGDAKIQGEILGITNSMNSLAQAVPALIGGYFVANNYYAPLFIAAICALVGWILYLLFYKMKHHEKFVIEN